MINESSPVKLILSKNSNNTWNKVLIDLFTDEIILEHTNIPLFRETNNKEYFDNIINQCIKHYNIVEIERFI